MQVWCSSSSSSISSSKMVSLSLSSLLTSDTLYDGACYPIFTTFEDKVIREIVISSRNIMHYGQSTSFAGIQLLLAFVCKSGSGKNTATVCRDMEGMGESTRVLERTREN